MLVIRILRRGRSRGFRVCGILIGRSFKKRKEKSSLIIDDDDDYHDESDLVPHKGLFGCLSFVAILGSFDLYISISPIWE